MLVAAGHRRRRRIGLAQRPAWTPADLPPGVWLYGSPREIAGGVALNTDGTGTLDGLDDSSTAGYLADLSPNAVPLTQTTAGRRPIVGYSPVGRSYTLFPDGGRRIVGSASLAGGRHIFMPITFRDADALVTTQPPVPFGSASQAIATQMGATADTHTYIIGLGNDELWVPLTGGLTITPTVSGISTKHVGLLAGRRRTVYFPRSTDAAAGRFILLSDSNDLIPSTSWVHGDVHVLSALASADDLANMAEYMAWHEAAPVVFCGIDSLSAGYNVLYSQSVPSLLHRKHLRGCVSVVNGGISGQALVTAVAGDPAKLDSVAGTGRNVLVLCGGANDIGAGAATTWSRIQAYIAMANAHGWEVIVCSIPNGPYWASVGQDANVAAVRDYIAGGWLAAGAVAFVDLYNVAHTTQGDGLHYDVGGSITIANEIAAAVETVLAA